MFPFLLQGLCALGGDGKALHFSEDFSLLVAFLLVTFSWLFRGFFVALFCLEKQCLGLFSGFFVAFSCSAKFTRTRPGTVSEFFLSNCHNGINSVQTRCTVKGEARSLGIPQENL